jgi:hypothetical protein
MEYMYIKDANALCGHLLADLPQLLPLQIATAEESHFSLVQTWT